MQELKLSFIESDRTRGKFNNSTKKWHYKITTGSGCKGLISAHKYSSPVKATEAGERMIDKLKAFNIEDKQDAL